MSCFVTVGTTKFDALIKALDCKETVAVLQKKGIHKLIVQYGRGECKLQHLCALNQKDFEVETFDFTFKFKQYIDDAKFIISHAGAGSILETLRAKKPLCVVVNQDLMDNHQVELASALAKDQYLEYGVPKTLLTSLAQFDLNGLRAYPAVDTHAFPALVDQLCGEGF